MVDLVYAAALGVVAGVIPVYLGLIPVSVLRRISSAWSGLLGTFSVGILLFLFIDVMEEAVELTAEANVGVPLLMPVGFALGLLPPALATYRRAAKNGRDLAAPGFVTPNRIFIAYMIALGIGLHNFGEGLALGASYAAGTIGLTTLLVVGFALHNSTEGFGIVAPVSGIRLRVRDPILMGSVAGVPTVFGSLAGSLAYSHAMGAIFFGAAGGALLFVIIQVLRVSYSSERSVSHMISIIFGLLIMYFTGLLVS